jgi:DNA-directed RNA polymerase specialized sigma24 family protein
MNRERAGEVYEELRLTLVKFFAWRNALFPDELADETVDRLVKKLETETSGGADHIQNLTAYSYGIARLVYLESLRSPAMNNVGLEESPPLITLPEPHQGETEADDDSPQLQCFRQCLNNLPNDTRKLLEEYYQDEKRARIDHRKKLARILDITPEALRRRAKLGRDKLELCVRRCLRRLEWGNS